MRKNLKKFRIDLGLKQKDMAKKLNVSVPYYSRMENGYADPSYGFMEEFGKLFSYDDVWVLFKKY